MRRPLACGQLCRPEVGVPWRLGSSARMAMSLPCGVIRGSSDAPPAGLRPAVPTGGRRSPAAGAICTNGAVFALPCHAAEQRCAARWPAASCADRRSAFPGGWSHLHEWRCLCLAEPCGGAAMRRPLACGQLCRAPPGELPRGRRSKPSPRFLGVVAYCRARKTMAANSVRCLRDRGESVKGGPPFHKSTMTNRNSPPRAAGAQGSFDCRREAPGGPGMGAYRSQSA